MLASNDCINTIFRVRFVPSPEYRDFISSDARIPDDVRDAAVLFTQHNRSNFSYEALLPEKCVRKTFPAADFMLFWPLRADNPYNVGSDTLPAGPFPYGDRAVVEGVRSGASVESILTKCLTSDQDAFDALDELERDEANRLRIQSDACDIRIDDFLLSRFRVERLFWTYNHPSKVPIGQLCIRLIASITKYFPELASARLAESIETLPPEGPLALIRVPIHPFIAQHFKLQWYDPFRNEPQFGYDSRLLTYEQYFREMIAHSISARDLQSE